MASFEQNIPTDFITSVENAKEWVDSNKIHFWVKKYQSSVLLEDYIGEIHPCKSATSS